MSKFSTTVNSDVQSVVNAASILHVSEFEIFRLAYQNWFGHLAVREEIDSFFHHYVDEAVVPMWVRDFSRRILQLYEEDRLDVHKFGIEPPPANNYWTAFLGGMAFAFIVMIIALLIYLAVRVENGGLIGCQFPPCY